MELAQIKTKATEVFKANPKAKTLIGVTDGHFFLPAAKNLAQNHARKVGGKLFEITRDGETTHPQEAAEKLAATEAENARKKAEEEVKAADAEMATAIANGEAEINLALYTIDQVTKWADQQNDVEVLTKALATCDTKGGKKAIEARIENLKTAE